jgi:hypothetical protein
MNLDNNWMLFAAELWPSFSKLELRINFEESGRMEAVLRKWGSEGATTVGLFHMINKIGRKDLILYLQEKFPLINIKLSE